MWFINRKFSAINICSYGLAVVYLHGEKSPHASHRVKRKEQATINYWIMTNFDKRKLTEMVLYILNKTNGLDYYHVFKVIYFANLSHLAKYGIRITTDEFCALQDGPVPSILYNSIKDDEAYCDKELAELLHQSVVKGADDAYFMLSAKREANTDYLSRSEIEELDKSIEENAYLPYNQLRSKSHGNEWARAYHSNTPGRKVMDVLGMARDAAATEDMIEYIREGLELEAAVS